MFSLRFNGGFNWGLPRRPNSARQQRRVRAAGEGGAGGAGSSTLTQRIGGIAGIAGAGLAAGTVGGTACIVSQFIEGQAAEIERKEERAFDLGRALRVFGFGALLFGPYQHLLFSLFDFKMPAGSLANLLGKTALSQLALAPAVLAFLYVWSIGGDGVPTPFAKQTQRDLAPSTIDGWRLWLPAAAFNFLVVPSGMHVSFMTTVAAVWASMTAPPVPDTRYLVVVPETPAPAAKPAAEAKAPAPAPAQVAEKSEKKKRFWTEDKVTLALFGLWMALCATLKKD